MNERVRFRVTYHPEQAKIFFGSNAKTKIVAKGRRFGLTRGYANFVCEKMSEGVSPVLWVDTVYSNIDRYMERYFMPILRQIPPVYWTWRGQKKELTLFGSKLDMRSADRPELLEGFGYRLILLNEAGIILNSTYLWENAIRPMILDYAPDVIIGGTPKGRNLFFDLKTKACDRLDPRYADWEFFHRTSYDNPYLERAEIDKLVADLPENVRKQEIEAEFLEDSAAVFRNIAKCIGAAEAKRVPGVAYYMGVDLAKHVDFTVITILDQQGRQVHLNRFNKLDWVYQKQVIAATARAYNAMVVIDSTGVGDPIFDELKRDEALHVVGYKFDMHSKRRLIEALMLAFDQERIRILPDETQKNELQIFSYDITASGMKYSAPEGHHDDCVIALALANWGRQSVPSEPAIFAM